MKEFFKETGRLVACILGATLFVAFGVLLFIYPAVLMVMTNNPRWCLLYIISVGVVVGVKCWMGE